MATVDLNDVRKVYAGNVEAVKGVSIAIPDGKLCVLVGPSGCGKSTLLRMIAGLETITTGTVSIDGKIVNKIGPAERDIAMVFQNYALYPHMKVYDNMAYGLRNRGMAKDEVDKRVRAAAATLELAHLLERRPRELSGGQRQRVAMGRAIVRNPKVFLSTSRCRTSTPSCAARCASRSRTCSARSASPRSTSPTTSSRR